MAVSPTDLAGWTPVSFRAGPGVPFVDWCFTAGIGFDDPFFEQTVERCLRDPLRLLFLRRTSVDALVAASPSFDAIEPSGFVFHMSRCGSTLAAQMLGATGSTLVVSEAGPLEAAAASTPGPASEDERVARLRAMVAALGQRRHARQQHLVVKFDAWSTFDLPLIRRAFPDIPWAFLFREPVAVLESQLRQRGSRLVPGVLPEAVTGVPVERAIEMPQEEYCARALARICEAALANADDLALFCDYATFPDSVPDALATWFGIPVGPAKRRRMVERAAADAKTPSLQFEQRPTPQPTDEPVRTAAQRHLAPAYARLRSVSERAA
jgi:hypothetical protein